MGFVTGFTGGVTLTLGVAYLTVLAHQRNRERQADILRANAIVLNTLSTGPGTKPVALAPSRAEIELVRRAHFVEAAKDKWNSELEGAVQWAQNKDWTRVREDVEGAAGRVWNRVAGGEVEEGVKRVEDGAFRAKEEAVAFEQRAKEQAVAFERRAEAEARSVSAAAGRAVEESKAKAAVTLQERAVEAKTTAAEVVQRGVEKGRELVGKAQAAVGLVEDKVGSAAAATRDRITESDVERALRQRYETPRLQTAEEAFAERNKPIAQMDHSRLRGV